MEAPNCDCLQFTSDLEAALSQNPLPSLPGKIPTASSLSLYQQGSRKSKALQVFQTECLSDDYQEERCV